MVGTDDLGGHLHLVVVMTSHSERMPDWVHCNCGKRGFRSRGDARVALKRHYQRNTKGFSVYCCPRDDRYFHLGHLPTAVRKGKIGRDDITNRRTT